MLAFVEDRGLLLDLSRGALFLGKTKGQAKQGYDIDDIYPCSCTTDHHSIPYARCWSRRTNRGRIRVLGAQGHYTGYRCAQIRYGGCRCAQALYTRRRSTQGHCVRVRCRRVHGTRTRYAQYRCTQSCYREPR